MNGKFSSFCNFYLQAQPQVVSSVTAVVVSSEMHICSFNRDDNKFSEGAFPFLGKRLEGVQFDSAVGTSEDRDYK